MKPASLAITIRRRMTGGEGVYMIDLSKYSAAWVQEKLDELATDELLRIMAKVMAIELKPKQRTGRPLGRPRKDAK